MWGFTAAHTHHLAFLSPKGTSVAHYSPHSLMKNMTTQSSTLGIFFIRVNRVHTKA
jgi:hypothetical protein